MPSTSPNQQYWQDAISAISHIFRYKKAEDDAKKRRIRCEDFPESVAALRDDYEYCRASFGTEFRMDDAAADEWLDELVNDADRLQAIYERAISHYGNSEPAVPLRLL